LVGWATPPPLGAPSEGFEVRVLLARHGEANLEVLAP
jgi:hypothetical protein